MVVLGLSVRLFWYPMWWVGDCNALMMFVLDVSMLREYEGDGNAGVVVVSVGHEYVVGTRGSGIVFRDECGVWNECVKYVCMWLGAVWEVSG